MKTELVAQVASIKAMKTELVAEVASIKASVSDVESRVDAVKDELAANERDRLEAAERERDRLEAERALLEQRKHAAAPVSRIASALRELATPLKITTNALR
eukprot:COSAG06_NODE_4761_length_3975_cov_7.211042_4_plen_102_part_00